MCNVRKLAHTRTYGRSLLVRVLRTLRIRAPRYPCPSSLNSVLETPYTQAHTRLAHVLPFPPRKLDDAVFLSALKRLLHNRLASEKLRRYIPAYLPVLPIEKVGCPATKSAPAGCSLRVPERGEDCECTVLGRVWRLRSVHSALPTLIVGVVKLDY